ncbi:MAG: Bax inhibitor-1/YccA family protein [Blastocatellia bacterium]|nr:Bax inhibitor-1/YccA family protein [Blastocatellia bacterium]MBL8194595.1 Bax inhibitor-1/YccA family protein [Blastocatellia bacterium]
MGGFFQEQDQKQNSWGGANNWEVASKPTAATAPLAERVGFIRKVYGLFFAGILFAMVGVGIGFSFPPIMIAIIEHRWISLFVLIGAVIGTQAVRLVKGINLLALFGFTTLMGIFLSPLLAILAINNPASIVQSGVLTLGIFGGLTVYAFVSKKDFSFMKGMLTVGLTVVVLSVVLNIFLASSAFSFGIAVASLLLFSGYVLYDTQQILHRYPTNEYVAGALDLFLDVYNIFVALLRILNAGRN